MGSIYALCQPRTGEVRYVGQTKHKVINRVRGHLRAAEGGANVRVCRWLRSLDDQDPIIRTLEDDIALEDLDKREQFWIGYFLGKGHRLTNVVHTIRHAEVQSFRSSSPERKKT